MNPHPPPDSDATACAPSTSEIGSGARPEPRAHRRVEPDQRNSDQKHQDYPRREERKAGLTQEVPGLLLFHQLLSDDQSLVQDTDDVEDETGEESTLGDATDIDPGHAAPPW